jgi:hypothetical protein
MRKMLAGLIFALASLTPAFAQGFVPAAAPPWVYADNYGRWTIQGQNANSYSFTPASVCQITNLNFKNQPSFFAFGSTVTLAPVYISDVNGANSEVVTPGSAATQTQSACSVNLSPANSHTTFTLQSGTGGLQEAINTLGGSTKTVPYTIVLSPEWYKLVSGIASVNATLTNAVTPADIITNAICSANIQVVDVTANPWTYYGCNSSGKLIVQTPQAGKPSVAAGAGAGTSPTIALAAGSNNSSGTVTLTSGTSPTASAAIFTLTFAAPDYGGGFPYAPKCTFTSVGTTAYTSGVASSTAGSGTTGGTGVLTASAAALAASTSGYKFTYSCH